MKTLALLVLPLFLVGVAASASAQDIAFANYGPAGLDAPVTNVAGVRIGPGPYVADLFWSTTTNSSTDGLVSFGLRVNFTSLFGQDGYFLNVVRMPTAEIVLAQARVWHTGYGSTYFEARDNGGEFGYSNPVLVRPGLPPAPATPMFGLQGFQLQVPEPTSSSLVMLGAIVLLLSADRVKRRADSVRRARSRGKPPAEGLNRR